MASTLKSQKRKRLSLQDKQAICEESFKPLFNRLECGSRYGVSYQCVASIVQKRHSILQQMDQDRKAKKSKKFFINVASSQMENIINLGIPHVGELIFESFDTPELINCLEVSLNWKVLAENILIKRWKGKMIEACKSGETEVVQVLLERCSSDDSVLKARNENGNTALMLACGEGYKDVVHLLLNHYERIELNARSNSGMTAFMWACMKGYKCVVQLLLNYSDRIELNARSNNGMTAFMWACMNGHKDVVQLLLDHSHSNMDLSNIDLNARDIRGYTALIWACVNRQEHIFQLLMKYRERIDLDARIDNGQNAFMIRACNGMSFLMPPRTQRCCQDCENDQKEEDFYSEEEYYSEEEESASSYRCCQHCDN